MKNEVMMHWEEMVLGENWSWACRDIYKTES